MHICIFCNIFKHLTFVRGVIAMYAMIISFVNVREVQYLTYM